MDGYLGVFGIVGSR